MKSRQILLAALLALTLPVLAAESRPVLVAWSPDAGGNSVLIRNVRWRVPAECMPARELGSDAAGRDLGAANAGRELGGDAAGRDLGSANAGRELGSANAGRELGADAAGRELGSANAGRELGGDAAGRELGGDASGRDLGAANAARELGADAAGRDLGAVAAGRDLGAANSSLACEVGEDRDSVIIHGVAIEEFALPDDSHFTRFTAGPEVRSVRVHL